MSSSSYSIQSNINEIYAETNITHSFFNNYDCPREIKLYLPIQPGTQLIGFEIMMGKTRAYSKMLNKTKAQEKFNDTVASGNAGIITDFNAFRQCYEIIIANVLPKINVEFKCKLIQHICSDNGCKKFTVMNMLPKFNTESLNDISKVSVSLNLNTTTQITYLDCIHSNKNIKDFSKKCLSENNDKYLISFYVDNSKINSYEVFIDLRKEMQFCLLFKTKNILEKELFRQYNPTLEETNYLLNFTYKKEEKESKQLYPSAFFFVVDQSGSMSGKPIELVKETLKIFMQSLPAGSVYQLIGFGSSYKKYNEHPVNYTQKNVLDTIKTIDTLKGNMGGTELYGALKEIFNNDDNKDIQMPKHIFILTDGYLNSKKNETLDMIHKNSSNFMIHANGMGNDFDKDLITMAGDLGNGTSHFINDLDYLTQTINSQLKEALKGYLKNISFSNNLIGDKKPIFEYTDKSYIFDNSLCSYGFIVKGKPLKNEKINITFSYIDKEGSNIEEYFSFEEKDNKVDNNNDAIVEDNKINDNIDNNTNNNNKTNNNIISSNDNTNDNVIKNVNSILNNIIILEDCSNGLSQFILGGLIKDKKLKNMDEDDIGKLAKKYQILCEHTSLFAEIENDSKITEGIVKDEELPVSKKVDHKYRKNYIMNSVKGDSNISSLDLQTEMLGSNINKRIRMLDSSEKDLCIDCVAKASISKKKSMFSIGKAVGSFFGKIGNSFNFNSKVTKCKMSNDLSSCPNLDIEVMSCERKSDLISINKNDNKDDNNFDNTDYLSGKFDFMKMITSQNVIEGSWEENNQTNNIISKYKDLYEKTKKLVGDNIKISVTFIILYYIYKEMQNKVKEIPLIIDKAKNFLNNNNWSYDKLLGDLKL